MKAPTPAQLMRSLDTAQETIDAQSRRIAELVETARIEAVHAQEWEKTARAANVRLAELQRALEEAKTENQVWRARDKDETWYWQGDGGDFVESLTCPVIMRPQQLRDLLARAEAADKDAARYRWLRKAWIICTQGIHRGIWMNLDVAARQSNDDDPADAFDASIDAALATAHPSEG